MIAAPEDDEAELQNDLDDEDMRNERDAMGEDV